MNHRQKLIIELERVIEQLKSLKGKPIVVISQYKPKTKDWNSDIHFTTR